MVHRISSSITGMGQNMRKVQSHQCILGSTLGRYERVFLKHGILPERPSGYLVLIDVRRAVDVHSLVGVYADADLPDVGVDQSGGMTGLEVGQETVHVDLRQEDKVPNADLNENEIFIFYGTNANRVTPLTLTKKFRNHCSRAVSRPYFVSVTRCEFH